MGILLLHLRGTVIPTKYWKFTPEEAGCPGKLTCHRLIEGCFAYPGENQQLLVLYWVLACAYIAKVQYSQRTMVETGTQTTALAVLPVLRQKQ